MIIDPGKMRRKVVLQKYVVTSDEIGNEITDWKTEKTLYCAANGLYGAEYWEAAAQGQQDTLVFTLRWSPSLGALAAAKDLTRYRLLFEGRPYQIQSYDDLECARRLVKLKAVSR